MLALDNQTCIEVSHLKCRCGWDLINRTLETFLWNTFQKRKKTWPDLIIPWIPIWTIQSGTERHVQLERTLPCCLPDILKILFIISWFQWICFYLAKNKKKLPSWLFSMLSGKGPSSKKIDTGVRVQFLSGGRWGEQRDVSLVISMPRPASWLPWQIHWEYKSRRMTLKNMYFKKWPFSFSDNACPSIFPWQAFNSAYVYSAMPGTHIFSWNLANIMQVDSRDPYMSLHVDLGLYCSSIVLLFLCFYSV